MPPGIPVATVGLDASRNEGILAVQILGTGDKEILKRIVEFKSGLSEKIVQANEDLKKIKYQFKVN